MWLPTCSPVSPTPTPKTRTRFLQNQRACAWPPATAWVPLPPQFLKLGPVFTGELGELNAHTVRHSVPPVQPQEAWLSDGVRIAWGVF